MAFENINVTSARNAINSCINAINHSQTEEIMSNIQNNNVWSSSSRDVLKTALNKLINEKYKPLKEKLKTYLTVIDNIDSYKTLQNEVSNLRTQLSQVQTKLNNAYAKDRQYKNENRYYSYEAIQNRRNIQSYTIQISQLKNSINNKENRMATLKSSIDGAI